MKMQKESLLADQGKQHGSLPSTQGFGRGGGWGAGEGEQQGKYWKILKTLSLCHTQLWVAKSDYPQGGGIPSPEMNINLVQNHQNANGSSRSKLETAPLLCRAELIGLSTCVFHT